MKLVELLHFVFHLPAKEIEHRLYNKQSSDLMCFGGFFGARWPSLELKHTVTEGLPVYYKIRPDPFVLLAPIFERLPGLFLFRSPLW